MREEEEKQKCNEATSTQAGEKIENAMKNHHKNEMSKELVLNGHSKERMVNAAVSLLTWFIYNHRPRSESRHLKNSVVIKKIFPLGVAKIVYHILKSFLIGNCCVQTDMSVNDERCLCSLTWQFHYTCTEYSSYVF